MTNATTAVATFAPSIQMHHATRAKAEKLATMLAAEYPRLTLEAIEGDEIDHAEYDHNCGGFTVVFGKDAEDEQEVYSGDKVPSLALILDTCAEENLDPSAIEEEEPQLGGSVVPAVYRALYRSVSSTGRCNGDWLAERLAADTLDSNGKLLMDDFIAILTNNGVDLSAKWASMRFSQTGGWQGRFRMNGRQVLEKLVVLKGHYVDHTSSKVTPHAEWLELMETKHGKWLAKQRKAEAAADEAIKTAVGA